MRRLLAEPPLDALLALLNPAGEETRIVGGALRNAALGLAVADIDLATTMLPETVMAHARAAAWEAVPTGIEHGTVTLVREGRGFEVTTLREDIETDGRRALVRFGRDFSHDAARRDFTINALSMGPDGALHDYFDGLADLGAHRVRFIGDPAQRIREDYLRALRFLRFSAAYGGGRLDVAGLAAVSSHREGFARLSRERVRQEIVKLVMARDAAAIIGAAEAHGLVSVFIGCGIDAPRFARALELGARHGVPLDAMARLAALVGEEAGAGAETWQARLRLSNAEIRALEAHAGALASAEPAPRLLAYRLGALAPSALILRVAFGRDAPAALGERIALACLPPPRFEIAGADLLAAGLKPGPIVGETLAAIEAAWIKAGFPEGRTAQVPLLEAVLARPRAD